MIHILFVCTGNTCRSPMAEAAMRHLIKNAPALAGKVEVQSAGLFASRGEGMSPGAQSALEQLGITAGTHSARRVEQGLIDRADWVLACAGEHLSELERRFAQDGSKMRLLAKADIADPFGAGSKAYEACLRQIMEALTDWCARLSNNE